MDKKSYLDVIATAESILKAYDLSAAVSDDVVQIRKSIDDYACRVMVIGGFNAGKSAFLNTILDRDLLEEAQIPETAIAAEICYGREEYIEAVGKDGQIQRFQISEGQKLLPKDWLYLVYHVNSPYLQEHPGLVLVDMPGLDSDIEWHNKAIAQYIGRGSAYILMVSCEDGTLRASVRDFLQEVHHYPQDLYCFVSKTDLRQKEAVESVVKAVRFSVQRICGERTPVDCISIRTDPDFKQKAETALQFFNSEKLFREKYAPVLNGLIDSAVIALQNTAEAMTLDTDELNKKIARCKGNCERLEKQLEDEKRKMVLKNKNEVTPAVIRDVEAALTAQANRFATALTVSPEAFSSAVNSALRVALYNANCQIQGSFADLVAEMDLSFLDEDYSELQVSIREGLERLSAYVQINQEQEALLENGKRAYQAITGVLAIVTDFINPVLELAIVLLPSIISLFSGAKSRSKKLSLNGRSGMPLSLKSSTG